MAKRFTDTEKWKDDWYLSLSNDYKIVWLWLLDNCNHAGICKRSINFLNKMCDLTITEEDLIKNMNGRLLIYENNWFIPKFIKFQYSTLDSKKPVIVSVVKELIVSGCFKLIPKSFGEKYTDIFAEVNNSYNIHSENISKITNLLNTNEIHNFKIIVVESLDNYYEIVIESLSNSKVTVEEIELLNDLNISKITNLLNTNEIHNFKIIVVESLDNDNETIKDKDKDKDVLDNNKDAENFSNYDGFTFTEAGSFAAIPYESRNEEFKKIHKEDEYVDYQLFIREIWLNKAIYPGIVNSMFQVTLPQFKHFLSKYPLEEIMKAVGLLCGNGIKKEHVICHKIVQYLGIGGKWKENGNLSQKNANNTILKSNANIANYTNPISAEKTYGKKLPK